MTTGVVVHDRYYVKTIEDVEEELRCVDLKFESKHVDFYETHSITVINDNMKIIFWFAQAVKNECFIHAVIVQYVDSNKCFTRHKTTVYCEAVSIRHEGVFTKWNDNDRYTAHIKLGLIWAIASQVI